MMLLEPGIMKDELHETMRNISVHNKNNLLDMIGVDPVIIRTETRYGTVDLQIWITTLSSSGLKRYIMPFYFIGSRKYLFMCYSNNCKHFISEIIDITSSKLNALNEVIVLFHRNGEALQTEKIKEKLGAFFQKKGFCSYSFVEWAGKNDLSTFFNDVASNLMDDLTDQHGFRPVGFDPESVQSIIQQQGFEISPEHEVIITKEDITFRVDLLRNIVFAEKSDCTDCKEKCKVTKKLCIEIADEGYSNISGLGDLRVISVLFAIEDGSIFTIKGRTKNEDLAVQMNEWRKQWKKKWKKK
jgi:hypothetical protein